MAGSCSGKDSLMCDGWSTGVAAGCAAVQILPACTNTHFGLPTRGRKGPGAAMVPTTEQPELEQLRRGRLRAAGGKV